MLNQNSYVTDNTVPITAKETSGAQGWGEWVGYDYQWCPPIVFGAFGDYDFMNPYGQQHFNDF